MTANHPVERDASQRAQHTLLRAVRAPHRERLYPLGGEPMNSYTCSLCSSSAETNGQDYGTRFVVRCPRCGYYVIEHAAIKHIQSDDFGEKRREEFRNTISAISQRGGEAEIVLTGGGIRVRSKQK